MVDEGVFLGVCEEGEEILCCFDDVFDWEFFVLDWEEVRTDFACWLLDLIPRDDVEERSTVSGDPFEWLLVEVQPMHV